MNIDFFSNFGQKFKLKKISDVSLIRNLIGSFVCILAYSMLFYIILIHPLDGDKASSLASMFSFAATLYAPVGAFFLIDNWKSQTKYNEQLKILSDLIITLNEIQKLITKIKYEKSNGQYFTDFFDYLYNGKNPRPSGNVITPDFSELYSLLNKLENNKQLLELYSQEYNNILLGSDGICEISIFKSAIEDWNDHFFQVKEICLKLDMRTNEQKFVFSDLACSCSGYFYKLRSEQLLEIGIPSHNESEIYYSPMSIRNKVTELREKIESYR